ncbi:MAG: hypothetical protein A2040_07585 [Rhodocyclales bacterium GWA2_65_19]|nr:MAG: hypothetical protein A2040_07585 [Rhodocyclales bacterium GWA2_65_19]
MDKYWKSAIAFTGLGGVGAFVFWSLYQGWLQLGIFSKLTSEQTFQIMILFLCLTFLGLIVLVLAYLKSSHSRTSVDSGGYHPDLPDPIAAYTKEFPEFLRKPDIDTQCVHTSRESFFAAVRKILSSLGAGAEVISTDNLSLERNYVKYWFSEGLGYLELNYQAAKRGVRISRILIVTKAEFEKHKGVLDAVGSLQAMSGVTPYVVFYEDLPDICKREFVVFDNRFVDEAIYDMRSEMVIDNYISWSPEKLNQFREKIELIRSHIDYSWKVDAAMSGEFTDVRQFANKALQQVLGNASTRP